MGDRLRGKAAIITGAGSIGPGMGNGKASSLVYAREGAKVMLVDYNLGAAEETKRMIEAEGGECTALQADVTQSVECRAMAEACVARFGRIDVLHNNVGITIAGGAVEQTEEDWDRILTVNLKSMFLTCKHVLPHMERQGSGVIVNIASLNAILPSPSPTPRPRRASSPSPARSPSSTPRRVSAPTPSSPA